MLASEQKVISREKQRHESTSMAAALTNSDYKTFGASVKKHSRYNDNIPSTIDDANNATDIANIFADRYSDLNISVPYDVSKMSSITSRIDNLIMSKCVKGDCQFGLNIFYFIYMKSDWAEHRCYVEALSHTTYTIVLTYIINHRHIHTTHSHKCHQCNTIHSETSEFNPIVTTVK